MHRRLAEIARIAAAAISLCAPWSCAFAQQADWVFKNGKILTVDDKFSVVQALAVRDGRILATGTNDAVTALALPNATVVDLGGRTVIPGLTDGHIHGIRAALTFGAETSWIGVPSVKQAVDRIREAARSQAPGSWIIVAGGWTARQFAENRRPTVEEVTAAAPDNPVYIQELYSWLLLTPKAMRALNIREDSDVPPRGKLVRDAAGRPTGEIEGDGNSLLAVFDKLPKPTFEQQVAGSKRFFRDLNRYGETGIIDGGGASMYPASYGALFKLWGDRELTVRVAYHLSAPRPGSELEDLKDLTQMLPQNFGDDMLHFNGPGEILVWSVWTDGDITPDAKERLYDVLRWAAERRYTIQIHWNPNRTVANLFDVIRRVDQEFPVRDLRWAVLHLYDATDETLAQIKALGLIWDTQIGMFFGGERLLQQRGEAVARRAPPIATAIRLGVMVGGGTDAHRVAPYNPFVCLQWYLDGTSVGGLQTRAPDEAPTRAQALGMWTKATAYMAHDDAKRGTLEPGKLADFAVLSADYMTVPVGEVGRIESLLTVLGGHVVYASGPFASLEGTH
jgi:predicted amidohydrolase YtcJ